MKLPFFTSDTHFSHANIIKFCNRPFSTAEEMDEALIENHNRVVSPKDTVYHLGDVAFCNKERFIKILKRLNGHKHLILGNHDYRKESLLKQCFETVEDYKLLKLADIELVLMHYPIASWYGQYHGVIHLHGHTHGTIDNSGLLRFDVGVDCWNMTPVNLEQIIEEVPKRLQQSPANLKTSLSKFKSLYERAVEYESRTENRGTDKVAE